MFRGFSLKRAVALEKWQKLRSFCELTIGWWGRYSTRARHESNIWSRLTSSFSKAVSRLGIRNPVGFESFDSQHYKSAAATHLFCKKTSSSHRCLVVVFKENLYGRCCSQDCPECHASDGKILKAHLHHRTNPKVTFPRVLNCLWQVSAGHVRGFTMRRLKIQRN